MILTVGSPSRASGLLQYDAGDTVDSDILRKNIISARCRLSRPSLGSIREPIPSRLPSR